MANVSPRRATMKKTPSLQQQQRTARLDGRTTAWSLLGHTCIVILSIAIVALAGLGVLYVRMSHGPVSLKFLTAQIERGINAELAGVQARIDDALLALSNKGGIELRLTNLQLIEADGDVVATIPSAAVELSRSALWVAKLVPSRIDIINAQVFLFYSEAKGLSLSFAREGAVAPVAAAGEVPTQTARRVDLAALIAEASGKARQRADTSSYLTDIGVRDGVVMLDNLGVKSEWRVVDGTISLDPSRTGGAVAATATIASERGPWAIDLKTGSAEAADTVMVEVAIRDLVPRALGLAIPQLSLLETLDAPITADARFELTGSGSLARGRVAVDLGRGQVHLPAVADVPFAVDSGRLAFSYDGVARRLDLAPSTLAWGQSRVTVGGVALAQPGTATSTPWAFDFATSGGQLTAEEFGAPNLAIEQGVLNGIAVPATGEVRIDRLAFKAGATQFESSGQFIATTKAREGGATFGATLGPSSADALKVLWPRALSKGARNWVGERIRRGTIKGGTLRFVSGSFARENGVAPVGLPGSEAPHRLSLAMEATDIQAVPLSWLPTVEAPRALIRLENDTIEITVPDATVALAPNKRIPVKAGRFYANHLDQQGPVAEITYRTLSPLVPILDILELSPIHLLRANGVTTDGIDGKVDGQMKLSVPLIADLDAKDVKIEAKAKVFDAKAKQIAGGFDVQGATIMIDVTEAAVGAVGDLLINGVPVKLGWQRMLEDTGEKQPPLRLSANLDNADRTQLGIDVNHIVQGEVPVDILIEKGAQDQLSVRLRADLTNADIAIESIAWRKPPGRAVTLGADIAKGQSYKYELQNLKVTGEDIAIEGWAAIGQDNKLREVHLPAFTLNVVTKLDIQAILKPDGSDKLGTWNVKVRGPNFDGRDLFRSLFSVGPITERPAKTAKPGAGIDVDAEIDNVIGHQDVSLRGLKLKMSRRGDKMTFLDARGAMDGGAAVVVAMNPVAGEPRRLLADTTDAGQALRLIGFYPNMQSGRARLEVNVDGRGPAEKTGVLWVDDFRVLGDPIVSEVLGAAAGPGDEAPAARVPRRKTQQREVFDFNNMKVPFSVGYGQFVIENAYLRGPLLGVNVVGKLDFKLKSLNLGGTYIPLQGLNNALGDVPLLGALVSGPKGEGAFGITFAVQGPMASPQVLVNPLSLVAPGIFREMFQMTNPNPKVVPRDEKGPAQPVEQRVRASSPSYVEPERAKPAPSSGSRTPEAKGETVDGWSSQTAPQAGPKLPKK